MPRDFPGSGGVGIAATAIAAQDGFSQMTIAVKYQRTAGGGEFGYGRPFTKDPYWQIQSNNGDMGWGIIFEIDWTSNNGVWSVSYPSNGTWIIDVITYDGSSASNDPLWYRNGSNISTTERSTPSGSLATDTSDYWIGQSSDNTEWDGPVDWVAHWNRVLSADEAIALGKGVSPKYFLRGLKMVQSITGRRSPEIDEVGGIQGVVTGSAPFFESSPIYLPG